MTGTPRPAPHLRPVQRGAKSTSAKQWKREVGLAHAQRTKLANGKTGA